VHHRKKKRPLYAETELAGTLKGGNNRPDAEFLPETLEDQCRADLFCCGMYLASA
jgi:hypothetical protein